MYVENIFSIDFFFFEFMHQLYKNILLEFENQIFFIKEQLNNISVHNNK